MEKIYPKHENRHKFSKASSKTVEFLLNYSKSLLTVKYKEVYFEINLN